jgi:integrase
MVEVQSKNIEGVLNASEELQPKPQCPKCGSLRFVRCGWRKNDFDIAIQRYSCKECDRLFDDPNHLNMVKQAKEDLLASVDTSCLNANSNNNNTCFQISAEDTVKNLVTKTQQTKPRFEETKTDGNNIDLVLADYKHYIQKEHIVNDLTLSKYLVSLKYLSKIGVNLFDSEDFKTKLAFDPELSAKSNCYKNSICKAYTSFVKRYLHMEDVKIPRFEYRTPEYKLPLTEHMELLYAALSFQMQVFCFVLMATAARPIEALRLEWKDIDFVRTTISINKPAKHGRTRTISLKGRFVKVIAMLEELKNRQYNIATSRNRTQKNLNLVFTYGTTDSAGQIFRRARKRAAKRLGIPELNEITFYSNRHWRAVLERYLKGNSDAVANLLGENSDKYVQVYAPISERLYGSGKEWDPIEISETDPDYSDKMSRYGAEGYEEFNYNRTTGRHYLRKVKDVY